MSPDDHAPDAMEVVPARQVPRPDAFGGGAQHRQRVRLEDDGLHRRDPRAAR
jgi:hypothetical protein